MPKNLKCNGINSELINWLRGYTHLESILPDDKDFEAHLIPAICNKDHHLKVAHSKEVIKKLWYQHDVLGPYPFLETLSEFEFDRKFYHGYRDHASHQLKVFLLGLYFFEKSPLIKKEVLKEIGIEDYDSAIKEFHLRWLVTAVYHDIGYVIENEHTNEHTGGVWEKTKAALNDSLHFPLSNLPQFKNKITREIEKQIIQKNAIFRPTVDYPVDIEFDNECQDFLILIKDYSLKANLGIVNDKTFSPLRSYYQFAITSNPKENRPKFRDHGIASALLLIKVWRSFNEYIQILSTKSSEELLKNNLPNIISLSSSIIGIEKTIYAAASAISLHNINKDIWDRDEAIRHNLTLNDFWLRLESSNGKEATPLGFLLGLTDSIQCWDRPMYHNPTTMDRRITDEDINMTSSGGKIFISFTDDTATYRKNPKDVSDSFYAKLLNGINRYVDPKSVNKIVDIATKTSKTETKHLKIVEGEKVTKKQTKGKSVLVKAANFDSGIPKDDLKEAFQLIEKNKSWLVGAVNFDEDLHFSAFYLYQSWKHRLPEEFKEFGYNNLIACYKDFKEIYFIPEEECKRVAETLIVRIMENPFWFNNVLDKSTKYADELLKVFPFSPDSAPFNDKKNYELADYYKKHNLAHTMFYVYSRLPEALDRGKNYFTNHLKEYLQSLHPDLQDKKTLNEAFEIFTFPEEASISGNEFIEFIHILEKIKNDEKLKDLFSGSGSSIRKIILKAKPKFLEEIRDHREKWTYWNYHGYGSRVLRDISFFLEKFKQSIDDISIQEKAKAYQKVFDDAEEKKMKYFKKYEVNSNFQMQFRLYSKIGAVKLYRRYIQLQNFYFLDQLISKISHNFDIEEEIIRNLFPEEVEQLLKHELKITDDIKERVISSAIIFDINEKKIFTGESADKIRQKLKAITEQSNVINEVLTGEPCAIQPEIIKGHCKVIKRKSDIQKTLFNHGDILVCEAADPDLHDLMNKAGAVLTEQGGATSHAATYCRENNIASITGIIGLLDNINNNDLVEIDTSIGTVTNTSSKVKQLIVLSNSETANQNLLGGKAFNLLRLKKEGFNVPDFFCIPLDSLRKVLQKGTEDSVGSASELLWDEVNKALSNLHGELFAVRSSYSNEDSEQFSGAGINRSELHVAKEDIINTIINSASEIIFSNNNELSGSMIIQQMILGDVSGILFSKNPVTQNEYEILLEAVPGGNELLTDGLVKPIKFLIDKKTRIIKDHSKKQVWKDLISEEVIKDLANKSIAIEKFYSTPQDIEWTISNGFIYILQSRPITSHNPNSISPTYKKFSKQQNDIISIYQSYRVPENLRTHMLQVSAVGKWIIDNWGGKRKLNEKDILTTLLLHDIGNLVKVPYDSYSNIFPEGYKYLAYWKEVQNWVRARYGNSDTQATTKIAKEIGVSDRIIFLLENKQFVNNEFTSQSDDFELKICAYSDQRVSPYGILPIKERLQEAVNRYKGNPNASVNNPKRNTLIECALKIESQIFSSIKKTPDDIVNHTEQYIKELRNFHFSD